MELIKKVNLLLSGLSMLLAFGCGGDAPEPKSRVVPVKLTCKQLSKIIWRNSSEVEFIAYNGSDRNGSDCLGGSRFGNTYAKMKYDDKRQHIILRFVCYQNRTVIHFSELKYDATGLLTEITKTEQDSVSHRSVTLSHSSYYYDVKNRLSKVIQIINAPNYSTGVDSVFYLPNNSIRYKKYIYSASVNRTILNKTIDYTFDTHKSAYAFPRWLYHNDITEGDLLPTDHNIASIKTIDHIQKTTNTISFNYEYNSDDFPITWTEFNSLHNGVFASGKYEYNCKETL